MQGRMSINFHANVKDETTLKKSKGQLQIPIVKKTYI